MNTEGVLDVDMEQFKEALGDNDRRFGPERPGRREVDDMFVERVKQGVRTFDLRELPDDTEVKKFIASRGLGTLLNKIKLDIFYTKRIKGHIDLGDVLTSTVDRMELTCEIDYPEYEIVNEYGDQYGEELTRLIHKDLIEAGRGIPEKETVVVREDVVTGRFTRSGVGIVELQGDDKEIQFKNIGRVRAFSKASDKSIQQYIKEGDVVTDQDKSEAESGKDHGEKVVDDQEDDNGDTKLKDPGIEKGDDKWTVMSKLSNAGYKLGVAGLRALEFRSSARELDKDRDEPDDQEFVFRNGAMFSKHGSLIFYTGFGAILGTFIWKTGLINLLWGGSLKNEYEKSEKERRERLDKNREGSMETGGDYSIRGTNIEPRREEVRYGGMNPPIRREEPGNISGRQYNLSNYNTEELKRVIARREGGNVGGYGLR